MLRAVPPALPRPLSTLAAAARPPGWVAAAAVARDADDSKEGEFSYGFEGRWGEQAATRVVFLWIIWGVAIVHPMMNAVAKTLHQMPTWPATRLCWSS